jgi:hypothetical protein
MWSSSAVVTIVLFAPPIWRWPVSKYWCLISAPSLEAPRLAAEPTYHIDPAELVAKGVVQVVEARHCFFTTHRRGKFPDRISALLQRDNSISDGSAPGAIIPHESIGFG